MSSDQQGANEDSELASRSTEDVDRLAARKAGLEQASPSQLNQQSEKIARQHPWLKKSKRSRAARVTISSAQILGVSYVAILFALVLLETRLVYPGAYIRDESLASSQYPTSGAAGVQEVDYQSADGTQLRGRLIHREDAAEVLVFFHGNGSKARWLDSWAKVLSDEFDATVLIAEYRGYEDHQTPHEIAVLEDCHAARRFICDRYSCQPTDLILYGRSLGGGCAVAMAAQGGAKALVLERTFDRLVDVAGRKYPVIPVSLLMRNRYDSIARLTAYDGPLVMLHGDADNLIHISAAKRLYESAGCKPKRWIQVAGLGHNAPLPSRYLRNIVAAVEEFTASSN